MTAILPAPISGILLALGLLLPATAGCGSQPPRVERADAYARQACAKLDEADVIRTTVINKAEAELQAWTAETQASTYAMQSEVPALRTASDSPDTELAIIREWCEVNR